ncbi:IS21 family transposase [Adlercreutzia caecimuris]|uniref:IS21 family transposase n=1 Tax=Adlercreutzia caecimuris TaxID=671266 RepID=A0A4S4FVA2_9ACTN|nr:IS21 family transposase [Adlercreutzia caecimuris]THG34820.1 IS21 family transposase [Adlercreutzia caecimuris]
MSKKKRMLFMLLGGGMSQGHVAAVLRCSKRDVSAAARVIREERLDAATVEALSDAEAERLINPPKEPKPKDDSYLQPDYDALVERKAKNRKLPVKLMWIEYCEQAAGLEKRAYVYQTFCEYFAEAEEKADARNRFKHAPGEKAFIDWAGDTCTIVDRVTGRRTTCYMLIFCLPFSCLIFAEAFTSLGEPCWLKGHMDAFDYFGGVPQMLVPDNCSTATDRTPAYITLVNGTYERFAEHYDCAVVPARVRKPRDKGLAESTVDLVELWIMAPANEANFHTLDELNEFVLDRVGWLNDRGFSDKDGSRRSKYEGEERECMHALPVSGFETYEPRRAKVSPDYHVRIDYMHYSVPHRLIGETCDIRLYASRVVIAHGGEVVAEHDRLFGRKGQFSTFSEHMPANHREMDSPWSRERFENWADRIGPATGEAVRRMLDAKPIVQQAFVGVRNVLGLSKKHDPAMLERACA